MLLRCRPCAINSGDDAGHAVAVLHVSGVQIMRVDGACHCGSVRFTAEADASRVFACHCTDCQVLTGSPYRVVVPAEMLSLSGELSRYEKVAQSGARRVQAFCPKCGTPVYSAPDEHASKVMLRVGTLTQKGALPPTLQIWQRSALPWVQGLSSVPDCQAQEALDARPPQ